MLAAFCISDGRWTVLRSQESRTKERDSSGLRLLSSKARGGHKERGKGRPGDFFLVFRDNLVCVKITNLVLREGLVHRNGKKLTIFRFGENMMCANITNFVLSNKENF